MVCSNTDISSIVSRYKDEYQWACISNKGNVLIPHSVSTMRQKQRRQEPSLSDRLLNDILTSFFHSTTAILSHLNTFTSTTHEYVSTQISHQHPVQQIRKVFHRSPRPGLIQAKTHSARILHYRNHARGRLGQILPSALDDRRSMERHKRLSGRKAEFSKETAPAYIHHRTRNVPSNRRREIPNRSRARRSQNQAPALELRP